MKSMGTLLYLFGPTLLALFLIYFRPKSRKIVPSLSVLFNIVLYGIITKSTSGNPGYMFPTLHIIYPVVCLAALFICLALEIIIRATGRWVCKNRKSEFGLSTVIHPSMSDIMIICIVLISPIVLVAPKMTGDLVLCLLVFLSASRLVGTRPRWIMVAFLLNGCALLAGAFLSLACNPSFQDMTGLRFSPNKVHRGFEWYSYLIIPVSISFGLALYSICKQIRLLTRGTIEPVSPVDAP